MMQVQITEILTQGLSPAHLEVINESHLHKGHGGDDGSGETHFRVVVISEKFSGLSRLARHRLVYALLSENLAKLPHALSIEASSPSEK